AIFQDGLLQYLLLCVVSVAMGLGILRLVRLDLPTQMALAFAPVLTAACWAVVLGVGVALRAPGRNLAAPLWALTLGLAFYGLMWGLARARAALGAAPQHGLGFVATGIEGSTVPQRDHARGMVSQGWLLATCIVLPVAVMFPYFVVGLTDHPR